MVSDQGYNVPHNPPRSIMDKTEYEIQVALGFLPSPKDIEAFSDKDNKLENMPNHISDMLFSLVNDLRRESPHHVLFWGSTTYEQRVQLITEQLHKRFSIKL